MDILSQMMADAPAAHEDGHFISAKVSRIVELIRDFDPRLDVKWVPPEHRAPGDAAFAIVERIADGREQPVFYVQTEEEMDERVLARIYESDVAHNDVMGKMEANNRAIKAAEDAKFRDMQEESHDLMRSVLKSGKHNYQHNGKTYRK